MKLHTKYQRHGPCGFREEDFFKDFPHASLCKTLGPRGRAIFGPRAFSLNNLGRGPLDEASYKKSKACALWFQRRRFLKIFPM